MDATTETEWVVNEGLVRWRLDDVGLKAADLAKELGVSAPYLSQMLKGRRRMSMNRIRRMARFLLIDPPLLIDHRAGEFEEAAA